MSRLNAVLLTAGILVGCGPSSDESGAYDDGDPNTEVDSGDALDPGQEPDSGEDPSWDSGTGPDGSTVPSDGGGLDAGPFLPDALVPLDDAGAVIEDAVFPPDGLPTLSASCVGVRYASTSDRIYVEGLGAVCSPRDIALSLAKMKTQPAVGKGLFAVDAARGIYYLGSNLFLREGAKLDVKSIAVGGDTNELRLKSLNVPEPNAFVYIRAEHGDIHLEGTRVRSWDDAAGGPDLEYETLGRAFIVVRSWLDADGVTPHESRMDVVGSEVSYLGYYAAESYGLVWKVIGAHTTTSGKSLFDLVNVHGDILNSNIHHNYFGVYTYGAYGVTWDKNEVHHNVQYGLDPHDDSDTLFITNNFVHHNGNHGIICSRRCDKLRIANNVAQSNTGVGIFLHGFVTDSVVEDNQCLDNTDAGIALFDSHRNTVRRNVLQRNQYGVRLSVGSSRNVFEGNEIALSTKYGLYFYKGVDLPVEGDGRPKWNSFTGNNLHGGAQALKMTDADDNTFRSNVFGTFFNRQIHVAQSHRNAFEENTFPVEDEDLKPIFRVEGTPEVPSVVTISKQGPMTITVIGQGTAVVASTDGQVYSSLFPSGTLVDGNGSKLTVANTSPADLRGDVHPLPFFATPTSGQAACSIKTGVWADNRSWSVTSTTPQASFDYRIGGLEVGSCHAVRREGAPHSTLTADADGFVSFSDIPGQGGPTSYVLSSTKCP